MTDRWPQFNLATDMADPQFEVEMKFSDCKDFRSAFKGQFIKRNKDVVFVRSGAFKLKAVCADPDCPWEIYASKMQREKTLQENPTVKSSWLSANYMETLKSNPSWSVSLFMKTVEKDYNTRVSRQQVYWAKERALRVKEDQSRNNNQSACKAGFIAEYRPIIGLDGCFLKGVYGGQFLAAVGIDANNEIWVIAYVVVESECKDSWFWFLELLVKDVEIVNQFGYTFI
ncbi:unnamed protein product [Prunus armeniaca]